MHIVVNLCQALFLIIALMVVVSYVIRKYELDNRSADSATPHEKAGFRDAALGLLGEIIVAFLCLIIYPFGRFSEPRSFSRLSPGDRPVILCHGYMHNRAAFFFIIHRLKKAGLKNLVAPNFLPISASIPRFAERLSEVVTLVISQTGCERVNLVGHSMGGLVVRYYIEHCGGASHVGKAIMLGTPNFGTKMAVLSPFETAKQFRIDSPLITDLNKSFSPRDSVEFISLWSDFDNIVVPPENAKLPEPCENIMIRGVGHLALLFSNQVITQLTRALSERSAV